jgi:hypothetical protein
MTLLGFGIVAHAKVFAGCDARHSLLLEMSQKGSALVCMASSRRGGFSGFD